MDSPQHPAVSHFVQAEHQRVFVSSVAPFYRPALQAGELDKFLASAATAFERRWSVFRTRSELITWLCLAVLAHLEHGDVDDEPWSDFFERYPNPQPTSQTNDTAEQIPKQNAEQMLSIPPLPLVSVVEAIPVDDSTAHAPAAPVPRSPSPVPATAPAPTFYLSPNSSLSSIEVILDSSSSGPLLPPSLLPPPHYMNAVVEISDSSSNEDEVVHSPWPTQVARTNRHPMTGFRTFSPPTSYLSDPCVLPISTRLV